MDINRAGFDVGVGIMPDFGQKLLFRDDSVPVTMQKYHDIHFFAGKFYGLVLKPSHQIPAVKKNAPAVNFFVPRILSGAPQDGFNPCHDLPQRKRFGDIIISPGFKSCHYVIFRPFGRDDDNSLPRYLAANFFAYRKPVQGG